MRKQTGSCGALIAARGFILKHKDFRPEHFGFLSLNFHGALTPLLFFVAIQTVMPNSADETSLHRQTAFDMTARCQESSGNDSAPLAQLRVSAAPLHVFHVDDSPDDHLLLKAAAETAGVPFSWDVAENADSAIFHLRTLLALAGKSPLLWPDIVLLDVSLPQGGGLKVLEFIRSVPGLTSLRVVVLSGSNAPGILQQAYLLGANSVLLKPQAFRDLVKLAGSLHAAWSAARRLAPEINPPSEVLNLAAHPAR
jgi:CheY-like chemotaxis protein